MFRSILKIGIKKKSLIEFIVFLTFFLQVTRPTVVKLAALVLFARLAWLPDTATTGLCRSERYRLHKTQRGLCNECNALQRHVAFRPGSPSHSLDSGCSKRLCYIFRVIFRDSLNHRKQRLGRKINCRRMIAGQSEGRQK